MAVTGYVTINGRPVPVTVAIEIQKPLAGRGPENSDFAYARSIPIPGDRQVADPSERTDANVFFTAIPCAVVLPIKKPLTRAWSKQTQLTDAAPDPIACYGHIAGLENTETRTFVDLAGLQSLIAIEIKMPFVFGWSEDGNAVLACSFPFSHKRVICSDAE